MSYADELLRSNATIEVRFPARLGLSMLPESSKLQETDHNTGQLGNINAAVCDNATSTDGFYSCCFSWSICLPDGMCFDPSGSRPQFYQGMCTDQSLSSPTCSHLCNVYGSTVYNSTTNEWGCCGDSCDDPPIQTFTAPAPSILLASTLQQLLYIPTGSLALSSTSSTTSTAATATVTVTVTVDQPTSYPPTVGTAAQSSSPTATVMKNSVLSAGAGVGIGIAASVGVLLLTLATILLLRRTKRTKKSPAAEELQADKQVPTSYYEPTTKEPVDTESQSYNNSSATNHRLFPELETMRGRQEIG